MWRAGWILSAHYKAGSFIESVGARAAVLSCGVVPPRAVIESASAGSARRESIAYLREKAVCGNGGCRLLRDSGFICDTFAAPQISGTDSHSRKKPCAVPRQLCFLFCFTVLPPSPFRASTKASPRMLCVGCPRPSRSLGLATTILTRCPTEGSLESSRQSQAT